MLESQRSVDSNDIVGSIKELRSRITTDLLNLGSLIEDNGGDTLANYRLDTIYNELKAFFSNTGSSGAYCNYINKTGRTLYGCMPSGSMQSCTSMDTSSGSTVGHQIDTFRGYAVGASGSYSYDYKPCTALWGGTDQDLYGSSQGYYIYRNPSYSLTVHTDYDGTSTRSLYGMLCCVTSSCIVGG